MRLCLLLGLTSILSGQVTDLTARYFGSPGGTTTSYFVQPVFPNSVRGSITGPVTVTTPAELSPPNIVLVNWSHVPGAVFYDVLRNTTGTTPSGACNCAAALRITGSSFTDRGGSLLTYTVVTTDVPSLSGNNIFSGTNVVSGTLRFPDGTGPLPGIAFNSDSGGTGWYKTTDHGISGEDLTQKWTSSTVATHTFLDNDSFRCKEGETSGERQICEAYFQRTVSTVKMMWLTDRFLRFGDPQGAAAGTFLGFGRLLADLGSATTLHLGSFPSVANDSGFAWRDLKLRTSFHTETIQAPHHLGSGSAPGISGCTATIDADATDAAGKVTSGTSGACSATLTFATAYSKAPACVVTNETTANLIRATSTVTTVVLAGVTVSADVLSYVCVGPKI